MKAYAGSAAAQPASGASSGVYASLLIPSLATGAISCKAQAEAREVVARASTLGKRASLDSHESGTLVVKGDPGHPGDGGDHAIRDFIRLPVSRSRKCLR